MAKNKKSPKLPPVSDSVQRTRAEQRAEASRLLREQKKRDKRRSVIIQTSIGLGAIVVVVATTIAILATRGSDVPAATPTGLTSEGALRFGADDAAVTVQAVEDFQCPACQQFEAAFGDLLADYRASDDVAVEYRPIAFLDRASTTDYSSRALNASMCVLDDAGPDAWMTMHDELYEQQPAEGGAGLDDDELTSLAADAGAGGDEVASCIEDRPYDDWAADTTQAFFESGAGNSTPTVLVNGEPVDASQLEAAVAAARS